MDTVLTAQALAAEPLTQAAFAPFGDVVEARGIPLVINQGRCYKYCDLTSVSTDRDGHSSVHIFKTSAIRQPCKLDLFERHPLGSQTFMPLEKQRFLVVVAESSDSDEPDLSTLRCFLTNGSQGVTYRAGVWHHPLLSLDIPSDFLVLDRGGPGHNCDEVPMPEGAHYTVEVRDYE
ncbi:ureidoglycolate lyase [Endozoicomonas euniceicola]|uniref:Ureidoglycolate lyase n=1 Tax=Endozoicomonas euniceicola TaxID=1234143 RepID=A0ABY6GVF5_9GAMM|nr:ureidoglycolate lyase [Endozoicomonas euniceicola]UYM16747.1 ureidoglycolate lyase [Endozoicomonas euniceicola]